MVQANLKVIISGLTALSNPFYGTTTRRKIVDETFIREHNTAVTAPHGIHAEIVVGNKNFNIEVSRTYLEFEDADGDTYVAYFHDDEVVYELWVKFSENGEIENIVLSEWLHSWYFENGEDADNMYSSDCFTNYTTFDI